MDQASLALGKKSQSGRGFLSPKRLLIAGAIVLGFLLGSANVAMWAACFVALPVAIWFVGGTRAYPILAWLVAMFWLQIIADLISSDLVGVPLGQGWIGQFREEAILLSLGALLALALGMRNGRSWGERQMGTAEQVRVPRSYGGDRGINLNRAVICYFISLGLAQAADLLAQLIPSIAQAFIAITLMKYVCIYLVAVRTFDSGRNRHWLILIALFEIVSGTISFFSSYKESVFVILIALASRKKGISAIHYILGMVTVALVVWMSVVWTSIKNEYRVTMFMMTTEQKIEWISQRYLSNSNIDYAAAFLKLSQRVGYTTYFAQILGREQTGSLPRNFDFYENAVEHILTPRVLFPDKPVLNDSKSTMALLGIYINERTSIGVGWVSQAYVDFGFPGMLAPIWLIGVMIGFAMQYFMTRKAPLEVRHAFATATLFLSFEFAANIDKSLGGFVTDLLAMGFILKFAYPVIARWLAQRPKPQAYTTVYDPVGARASS